MCLYELAAFRGQHVAVGRNGEGFGCKWKQHRRFSFPSVFGPRHHRRADKYGYIVTDIERCSQARHTVGVPAANRVRASAGDAALRPSQGRPPVRTDRIIDAALAIVDDECPDALSMRVQAQRLDSGTATLYRHFANRGELLARVVDRVFSEVAADAQRLDASGWQEACRVTAKMMFDALRRHRNVAALLVERVPGGPNMMAIREHVISVLLDNGFAPELAARCYATPARYVLGFSIQLSDAGIEYGAVQPDLQYLGVDRYPATVGAR